MAITLYDLAGVEADRRFSPFCWRTRMALAHKGLEVETVPWRFTEKDRLPQPNGGRVPVIVDGSQVVHDSSAIAEYLENRYPDRPSLFPGEAGHALTRFIQNWTETVLQPGLIGFVVLDIHRHIGPEDQAYFRQSREERFGRKLEEVVKDRDARLPAFRESLTPLRRTVERQNFSAVQLRPMPITSSSAPSSGPAPSATLSFSPPTIRSPPGAGVCSTCSAALLARVPPMAVEEWAGQAQSPQPR